MDVSCLFDFVTEDFMEKSRYIVPLLVNGKIPLYLCRPLLYLENYVHVRVHMIIQTDSLEKKILTINGRKNSRHIYKYQPLDKLALVNSTPFTLTTTLLCAIYTPLNLVPT